MEYYRYQSVLLVDDSYVDNLINRKILQGHGFARDINIIDCPKKAIAHLERCIHADKLPDIVFLDIRMPEMDGFQFLSALNKIEGIDQSDLKIYILSSSLNPADLKQIRENGRVSSYIIKPLSDTVLNDIG